MQTNLLKATRNDDTNHLRVRVQNLEGVGRVSRDRPIITLCQQASLLLPCALLRPELEPTLEVEEILSVLLVDVWQDAQGSAGRRVGAHQSKRIVRGWASHCEAVQLIPDGDGMRVRVMRNDIGAWGRRRVLEIELLQGCGLDEASAK